MDTDAKSKSFDEASSAFLKWFTSQPGTTFHPSLAIKDLRDRGAGRGIIATSDIPPDTDLFTIPRNCIISVETSDLAKKLPDVFEDTPPVSKEVVDGQREEETEIEDLATSPSDLPTPWLNLILILLHENLRPQSSLSKWHPYLSILPSHPSHFNTLMFWTPSDLSHLQASSITSKIGRETADAIFRSRILPIVKQHASTFYDTEDTSNYLSDEELLTKCHVIGSLIMSYAFDLHPDDDDSSSTSSSDDNQNDENTDGWTEDIPTSHSSTNNNNTNNNTLGMIPMSDLLNADAEFNAHLSHGTDSLTMTSLRTIRAGEEVLNYYGPLPNGELLRRYGYTSPKHERYDVVEVSWGVVKTCILAELTGERERPKENKNAKEKVEEVLRQVEDDEDNSFTFDVSDGFILERESGDPNEEGLCTSEAKFTKFPEELVDVISYVIRQIMQSSTTIGNKKMNTTQDEKDKERDLKRRVLRVLRGIVQIRSAEYATTLEEDEKLLSKSEEEIGGRLRMAITVRAGEKKVLREAEGWVEGMLKKYAGADSGLGAGAHVAGGSAKRNGTGGTGGAGAGAGKSALKGQPPIKKQKKGR